MSSARFLMAIIFLAFSATSAQAALPKAAVMPLSAKRISKDITEILDDLLLAALEDSGKFQVLGINDINAMLGLEKMKTVMGCSDVACAVEIGGALGVNYLFTGSVSRLGDELIVQLTLIDTQESRVVRRGRGTVENDETLYRKAMNMAAAKVLDTQLRAEDEVIRVKKVEPQKTQAINTTLTGPRALVTTSKDGAEFMVEFITSDGKSHECQEPVRLAASCILPDLAPGDAAFSVKAEGYNGFAKNQFIKESDQMLAFKVKTMPSVGSILSWTYGGLGLGTGVILVALGLSLDINGMTYGGLGATIGGGALLAFGFTFDGNILVEMPED